MLSSPHWLYMKAYILLCHRRRGLQIQRNNVQQVYDFIKNPHSLLFCYLETRIVSLPKVHGHTKERRYLSKFRVTIGKERRKGCWVGIHDSLLLSSLLNAGFLLQPDSTVHYSTTTSALTHPGAGPCFPSMQKGVLPPPRLT